MAARRSSRTADEQFLLSKRQYEHMTGRRQKHDVIAYQIRQSFKPGEVTPEEANRIGYEPVRFFRSQQGRGTITESPCSRHSRSLTRCRASPDKWKSLNFRVQSREVELKMM